MITTVHFLTCVVSNFKIHKNMSKHSYNNIALKKVHKRYLVSNEITKFQSYYIISYFFFPSKYTRWKMSETIISLHAYSSVNYTYTCLIWVPRTVQLFMINITFWLLILKWLNFLIILFWVSSKLIEWGFSTFFTVCRQTGRHATAMTNLWVDQCAVCSAIKPDTFT